MHGRKRQVAFDAIVAVSSAGGGANELARRRRTAEKQRDSAGPPGTRIQTHTLCSKEADFAY
eukprot:186987-Prymnesium_polylepis.1